MPLTRPEANPGTSTWFVYMLACCNGTLYTGISNNVAARYAAHCSGKGARYTRANPPEQLLAVMACTDHSAAAKAECAVKKMPRTAKLAWAQLHAMPSE